MPSHTKRHHSTNRGSGSAKGKVKTGDQLPSKAITTKRSQKSGWQYFSLGLLVALATAILSNWWTTNYSKLDSADVQEPHIAIQDFESPFTVVDIPGKGKGAVAARDIRQGELILREKPLFVVPLHINSSPTALLAEKLAGLTSQQREAFNNLSYVNFPEELNPEEHEYELALTKFETNGVSAGSQHVGIFPRMARLNHGCSSAFNVVYSWREKDRELVVYALKPVKKGQELLTTYIDCKKSRSERRAHLSKHYGFNCSCDVCSLPDHLSKVSDDRLLKIKSLYNKFATWGQYEIDGAQAIQIIREIWAIEDEEGYWSERGSLANDAAWIAASHLDASATQAWAQKALEWFTYEIGYDTPQVQSLLAVTEHPEVHSVWGTREALMVGGPHPSA